jgi:hypothetical protein
MDDHAPDGRPSPGGKGTTDAVTVVPGLLPADQWRSVRGEANRLRPSAERHDRTDFRLNADGRVLCARRNWFVGHGKVVKVVHGSAWTSGLEALVGTALRPTYSSYLYYERGDFLGLHRDHGACALTLVVWLSGPAGPLFLHPQIDGRPEDELLALATKWDGHPPGGEEVDIRHGPVLLRGDRVPHHRPPHPYEEELAVATLCFAVPPAGRGGPWTR